MLPLKPFPGPVPPWNDSMGPVTTRGNDNLLAQKVNELVDAVNALASVGARASHAADLYDPRFAPEDGDSIIATQVFGRHRT